MSRRKWSNASALDRRAPVPMNATCGITIAVTDVADLSRNGADAGVVLLVADCGTTKYSAESVVDALAANVTHPEAWEAAHPRRGKGRAFQQVFVIEYVVDKQLRANDGATERKGVARARTQDEARIDMRVRVEVKESPPIRRVRIVTVGKTTSIDPCGGQIESATRTDHVRRPGHALVVVEIEVPGRGIGREETAGDRVVSVGVVDRQVHIP